jgi:hypothetical protein
LGLKQNSNIKTNIKNIFVKTDSAFKIRNRYFKPKNGDDLDFGSKLTLGGFFMSTGGLGGLLFAASWAIEKHRMEEALVMVHLRRPAERRQRLDESIMK